MLIPEDVCGDGVQAHRLCHLQPRVPVFLGNSRIMHLAGDDAKRLAVQRKLAARNRKSMRLAIRRRLHRCRHARNVRLRQRSR